MSRNFRALLFGNPVGAVRKFGRKGRITTFPCGSGKPASSLGAIDRMVEAVVWIDGVEMMDRTKTIHINHPFNPVPSQQLPSPARMQRDKYSHWLDSNDPLVVANAMIGHHQPCGQRAQEPDRGTRQDRGNIA